MSLNLHAQVEVKPTTWANFKMFLDGTMKKLNVQYCIDEYGYDIFCMDGDIVYTYYLFNYGTVRPGLDTTQNNSDVTDFETNWKPNGNKYVFRQVSIKQWDLIPPDKAYTCEEGFDIPIVANTNPSTYTIAIQYNVDVMGGKTINLAAENGDYFDVYLELRGDPAFGTITEAATQGDDFIVVDEGVLYSVKSGFGLKIGTEDKIYRIKSVDYQNSKLYLTEDLTENKADDTALYLRILYAKNRYVETDADVDIGMIVFEPSGISTDYQLTLKYHHNTTPTQNGTIKFILIYRA